MFERFKDERAVVWAQKIKDRDKQICQVCQKYGVALHSHHLNSWDIFIDQRYDPENGICLCSNCHETFHSIYGKGRNTYKQFLQFIEARKLITEALKNSLG
jgi:predicted HNH restriction endonuclease